MSMACPKCFGVDEVTQVRGMDNLWTFTCTWTSRHDDGREFVWEASNEAPGTDEDVLRGLDSLRGPLLACLVAGEPFVEYGVVEWRLRSAAPQLFAELVAEHGHRTLAPKEGSGKTTSAYLSMTLGRLAAEGTVERVYGKATGAWDYNSQVTYWALPPSPPTTTRLSWEDFAKGIGQDPRSLL